VTEITPSEIKYNRFDNLNGPTIVVSRADVFAINYENGTREVFTTGTTNTKTSEQSDFGFGGNLIYGTGGFLRHIGIGAKFHYNVTNLIRFAGEFDFFPKKDLQGLDINGLNINFNMWDFSVYGHLVLSGKKKKAAFYPLVGIGMAGYQAEIELDLGFLGKHSDTSSDSFFVLSLGGGFEVNLTSNLTMNIEIRYKHLDLGNIADNVDFSEGWRNNYVFGLTYRF